MSRAYLHIHWIRYPHIDKIAAISGRDLVRLVATVAEYRDRSQWMFIANTHLRKKDVGGMEWLETFQAECTKHGIILKDALDG